MNESGNGSQPAGTDQARSGSPDSSARKDTRSLILRAAARLLAEKGLEGASLREITRTADQRNTAALQYHFGDREGLLRALIAQHVPRISARRSALLDHFDSRGDITLRDAASILVSPLVAELQNEEGIHFLQVAAHLVNSSDELLDPEDARGALVLDEEGTMVRWAQTIRHLLPEGATGPPLHRRFAAIRFAHIELGRRARLAPQQSAQLFGSQLIDLVAAMLGTELSDETRGLLRKHSTLD